MADQLLTLSTHLLFALLAQLSGAATDDRLAAARTPIVERVTAASRPAVSDCAAANDCRAARMRWQITLAAPAIRRCASERCSPG